MKIYAKYIMFLGLASLVKGATETGVWSFLGMCNGSVLLIYGYNLLKKTCK